MIEVYLPALVRQPLAIDGAVRVAGPAATLGQLIAALDRAHPGLREGLCHPDGRLRPHILAFDGAGRSLPGPATALEGAGVVRILVGAAGAEGKPAQPWRTLSRRQVYETPWVQLREDEVELPGGAHIRHAVVTLGSGRSVGVLPLLAPDRVLLVRQYRYVQDGWFWEAPSGAAHPGEDLEAAAQRELREEAGYRSGRLLPLTTFHTSKSVCREEAHLFAGQDLVPDPLPSDPTEDFEVRAFPVREVLRMVREEEIMDVMTVVAVLWAAREGLIG